MGIKTEQNLEPPFSHRVIHKLSTRVPHRAHRGTVMIVLLVSAFFAGVAAFALGAIVQTERRHAGAWDQLAAERRRLRESAARDAGEFAWPVLVSTRPPAEPAGPIAYQRRLSQRSAAFPLQPGRRAAA
ncbi:MAG: hypothetical protein KGM17_01310 [Sphingomonadales bacterium]|nr:hypothetical protein [Sphingomonadales bacterium]